MKPANVKRREFLAAAAAVPLILPQTVFGANKKLNIGFIGMGGDDAATRRAATAGSQVGVVEAHALLGQGVDVGRLNDGMPVASEIILGDVVGDEEDDVRFLG